jgi:hypothetical protein
MPNSIPALDSVWRMILEINDSLFGNLGIAKSDDLLFISPFAIFYE